MIKKDNEIRMPFAEWLFRMSEAAVPIQARGLATYAVLFKVTANEELAKLAGMDTKGLADKTYNKWKTFLRENGWVIIKVVTVGRVTTIEVSPALHETPVVFTDVKPRLLERFEVGGKISPVNITGKDYGSDAKVTGDNYGSPVEITRENYGSAVEVTGQNYGRPVEITAETAPSVNPTDASRAPARANGIPSGYSNQNRSLDSLTPLPPQPVSAAREGEEEVQPGLFVNCETIRHRDFTVSLKGIQMQLCGTVPMEQIKSIALGHALSWATDIAAGKRADKVVPSNTANFIRASIQNQANSAAVTEVRKQRASGQRRDNRIPLDVLSDAVDSVFDHQSLHQSKRLTHER